MLSLILGRVEPIAGMFKPPLFHCLPGRQKFRPTHQLGDLDRCEMIREKPGDPVKKIVMFRGFKAAEFAHCLLLGQIGAHGHTLVFNQVRRYLVLDCNEWISLNQLQNLSISETSLAL